MNLYHSHKGILFFNPFIALLLALSCLFTVGAPAPVQAASTLSAGDIAIIGFNYDDVDEFAFVLLVDVTAGTTINFTDNGWLAAGGFRAGEGTITWTAATDLTAGTVINPPLGSGLFALSTSGDQILAYQGTSDSPVFIYALNSEGTGWQADATNSNTSALPTGLVNGTSAVALNEIDNAIYTGITNGTHDDLLAAIGNPANWSGSDTTRQTMPVGPFTVGTPVDNPPAVASTIPADNATNVDVSANITVTFNEAVTTTAPWYTLTCGTETVSTTYSGGGAIYQIDPTASLPLAATCTATIAAAQVTDLDGEPASMTADYVFDFTTALTDTAPSVSTVTPPNGASGVSTTTNLTVAFSEPVDTAAGWYAVTCGTSGVHSAAVTGGPTLFTLDLTPDLSANETCTATISAAAITDQDSGTYDPPDNMLSNFSWSFSTLGSGCSGVYTDINDIQGSGATSPLTGTTVTTEGIVTFKRNATKQLGGFFLQAPPSDDDGNPATSEGIFVYTGTPGSYTFAEGDRVRLTGTVTEYVNTGFGQLTRITEIGSLSALTVCVSGQSVTPTVVNLPDTFDATFNLERYEGMLITIPETLTVQQNYFQGRFGQVTLGAGGRIAQMNNVTKGGGSLYDYTRMIILDDGSNTENLDPIPYYATDGAMRPGDTVANLTGVLDQGRVNSSSNAADAAFPSVYYRLHPTNAPVFVTTPRPDVPPVVGGRIKVASANVLNYFPTLDSGSYPPGAPYSGSNTPRGANTPEEFTRQQTKLIAELAALNADVYGLMEIESWDSAASGIGAPQALVNALNAKVATLGVTYAAVADPLAGFFDPSEGGDVIQTAIIYKTNTVTPVGLAQSSNDTIFSRSPFAQRFKENSTNEEFIVVVNHLKSKGSCPASGADTDQGDGQGCWNAKRILQAQALLTFINTTLIPLDPDVLVIGDMNAYGAEDPINTLTTNGIVNQVAAHVPEATRYSYVFDGTAGYLDHALTTASFTSQISDVDYWHINADEPSVIDYNTEYKKPGVPTGSPDLYQPHMYRASDHDPVLIGLNLGAAPNTPAVAVNDGYDAVQDTILTVPATLSVLTNDSDINGDALSAEKVSNPGHGTLVLNADGSFTYTPAAGFFGADSFTYKVWDGHAYSNIATVTITVAQVHKIFLPVINR